MQKPVCPSHTRESKRAFNHPLVAMLALTGVPLLAAPVIAAPVNTLVVNPSSMPVPVTVQSTPSIPGEGSLELFSVAKTVGFGGGGGACTDVASDIVIPSGKRLVVTYLSGSAALPPPAALVNVKIGASTPGAPVLEVPAAAPITAQNLNFSSAGQALHAFFEGTVRVCALASFPSNAFITLAVFGYLINKP